MHIYKERQKKKKEKERERAIGKKPAVTKSEIIEFIYEYK